MIETTIQYSLIIPVYNEEDSLKQLVQEISQTMDTLQEGYEVIFVNDGSTDRSLSILEELKNEFFGRIEIINLPQERLLTLDGGTSQWASAAVLLGDRKRLPNPPFKLKLTYEAVEHWNKRRKFSNLWYIRYDQTILEQAEFFLSLKSGRKDKVFLPQQAEDYCFARAFDIMTGEEGARKWPQLRNHESDRLEEMERCLYQAQSGKSVNSHDHRVIQAIAMRSEYLERDLKIKYPNSVNKSWPQFWKFLSTYS